MINKKLSILLSILISVVIVEVYAQSDIGGTWEPSDIGPSINAIAGIATAIALIFVGYETLMSRSERKNTLRAWVGQGEAKIFVDAYFNEKQDHVPRSQWVTYTATQKEKFNVTTIRRYLELKNYGQIPALNLRIRLDVFVDKKPTQKDIESVDFTGSSILMPNETQKMFFSMTTEESKAIENPSNKCYLIYEIEYDSPKNKKRIFGRIDSLSLQEYGTIQTWDENY